VGFYSHCEGDEPLAPGSPVDYLYLFQTLVKVSDDERDRLERIEGKIAVVVAGAFAALGFSLEKAGSIPDVVVAALYAIPVIILLVALLPVKYAAVPDAKVFRESFPVWPIASWVAACDGLTKLHLTNAPKIEAKAAKLRVGIIALIAVTTLLAALKCYDAFQGAQVHVDRRATTTSTTARRASGPHTSASDRRINDLRSSKRQWRRQ
jgi:hypothetical protein